MIEVLFVILLMALLAAFVAPSMAKAADRSAVRSARLQMSAVLAAARSSSVGTGQSTKVRLTGDSVWVTRTPAGGASKMVVQPLRFRTDQRVTLASSVDSILYDPRGLATNLSGTGTLRFARNAARDSICVTRTGMVAPRCGL